MCEIEYILTPVASRIVSDSLLAKYFSANSTLTFGGLDAIDRVGELARRRLDAVARLDDGRHLQAELLQDVVVAAVHRRAAELREIRAGDLRVELRAQLADLERVARARCRGRTSAFSGSSSPSRRAIVIDLLNRGGRRDERVRIDDLRRRSGRRRRESATRRRWRRSASACRACPRRRGSRTPT